MVIMVVIGTGRSGPMSQAFEELGRRSRPAGS